MVVSENNFAHNLVKKNNFLFRPPFSIFYRSPAHFMLRKDRGRGSGKTASRSRTRSDPWRRRRLHSRKHPAATSATAVSTPSAAGYLLLLLSSCPSSGENSLSPAIYFFDHLSILLMPNYSN